MGSKPLQSSKNGATVLTLCPAASTPWYRRTPVVRLSGEPPSDSNQSSGLQPAAKETHPMCAYSFNMLFLGHAKRSRQSSNIPTSMDYSWGWGGGS